MKKVETFKEFKEKVEIIMERDLKKIIKSYRDIPKTEYIVLRELVKTNPIKDVLLTVWMSAFHEGTKRARIKLEKMMEEKNELTKKESL